ncbi:MAG: PilZ domain-containing protein [Elusimicrobiota bacterium]|jgi:hypothetical protein
MFGRPNPFGGDPGQQRRTFDAEKQAKRVYARYACDLPAAVWGGDHPARIGNGRVHDISMGGILLHCPMELKKGTIYRFQIAWNNAVLTVAGQVARAASEGGSRGNQYGVSFTLSAKTQNSLKTLVEALRLKSAKPPVAEEKIKWYWGV